MKDYDFTVQLHEGEAYERQIDDMFIRGFAITPATRHEQQRGIDRRFSNRDTRRCFTVEYKGDKIAVHTGNAFIETVSVDVADKPGWVYTSEADYLFYYLPHQILYVFTLRKLRSQLPRWIAQYPQRAVRNQTYNTIGVLVPLDEFERHALAKVNL